MAQKKVILQDGSDELLPKTLASMVFTESGETVEAALQNAGGGGSSGGGTGNVNVTNASGLNKDNYYAFKPSADGSATGLFQVIPDATPSKAGLMSALDYNKLNNLKLIISLPVAVLEYNAATTSETITSMLQTAFDNGSDTNTAIAFSYIAASLQGEYNSAFFKFYIGDRECMLGGNVVTDGSSVSEATLEFSYVDGGKLHTVAITLMVGRDEDKGNTYTYSAKVLESGDDTYYLPATILNLKSGATHEDILDAFGGSLDNIVNALKAKKKIYTYNHITTLAHNIIPVSAYQMWSFLVNVIFTYYDGVEWYTMRIFCNATVTDQSKVEIIYPSGYTLSSSFFSLSSSSNTDEISTAVGGESGLKEIIQAVKDGNRLVIRGKYSDSLPFTSSTEVISTGYIEEENGDMQLILSYWIFLGIGASHFYLSINYTKSSNTFSAGSGKITS